MMKKEDANKRSSKGDPFFLSPIIPRNADTDHNKLIFKIVKALYREGFHEIWYDHLKEFVPRSELPNTIGRHRVDIVVQVGKGKYAFIDVEMVEKWR